MFKKLMRAIKRFMKPRQARDSKGRFSTKAK